MLKLLIDESIPYRIVGELRNRGFDVLSVTEKHKGLLDHEILNIAGKEHRIILTNDKGFGEMAYRRRTGRGKVILLRLNDNSFDNTLHNLVRLFKRFKADIIRKSDLIVVAENKIRIRSF